MATDYIDKKHADKLQAYKRKDADETEGGSVHLHEEIQINQILQIDGPIQFRTITDIGGVIITHARFAIVETVNLIESLSRTVKPPDESFIVGETFEGTYGFGAGAFGQGGFGGHLP